MNILRRMVSLLLVAGLAVMLAGCASTGGKLPQVKVIQVPLMVYSLAVPNVETRGKNYIITSAMKDLGDEDLEFQEAARYVRNALSQRGYTLVDSKEKADQEVRLAYGVGEPQTTTTTTTTGGYGYPVGWWWNFVPPTTQTDQTTVYTTSVVLAAYDLKTPGKLAQIWKTNLSYESIWQTTPKNSLVLVEMPNMLAAAVDYIVTNKGHMSIFLYAGECQAVADIKKQ